MNRRMRRIRTVLLLAAAVSIALVMVRRAGRGDAPPRRPVERQLALLGARDRRRRRRSSIVSIEDKTITGTTPTATCARGRWTGKRHAKVVDELHAAGAKVIAYDVQFTEPSGDSEEDFEADNALIEAVRAAAPTVVMATTEVGEKGETSIFGGGEGLEYSKATPATPTTRPTTTAGSAGWRSRSTG